MPKRVTIPLKDLKAILMLDAKVVKRYRAEYMNMPEVTYYRKYERYEQDIECKLCGRICRGEHGYNMHMKSCKGRK